MLLPFTSNAQLFGTSRFCLLLFISLFQETREVAISKHKGCSSFRGAVKQIGFVPKKASGLPNDLSNASAFVNANPRQSLSVAKNPK